MLQNRWRRALLLLALGLYTGGQAKPVDVVPARGRPVNDGLPAYDRAFARHAQDQGELDSGAQHRRDLPEHRPPYLVGDAGYESDFEQWRVPGPSEYDPPHDGVNPTILPPPQIVYRGSQTPPDEFRAAGVFLPSAKVPPTDENHGFSLYRHHLGSKLTNAPRTTAYVSATRYFGIALAHATPLGNSGWIYKVHASPNMVDLDGSLLQHRRFVHDFAFPALGGIRWDQVMAWIKVPGVDSWSRFGVTTWTNVTYAGFTSVFPHLHWISNPDYDAEKWDHLRASPGQPQLAGWFGTCLQSHREDSFKAEDPWSWFQSKTAREYYMDFLGRAGGPIGWTGIYPLDLVHRGTAD